MTTRIEFIKELRTRTGAGVGQCHKAMQECGGDIEACVVWLRKRGLERAPSTDMVHVFTYEHQGRIGVALELGCETDFTARSGRFQLLGRELCLQVAVMPNTRYIETNEINDDLVELPEEECVLMAQPSIRDPNVTVRELVGEVAQATGEYVRVCRFARIERGQP